jgi:hypothetical protein
MAKAKIKVVSADPQFDEHALQLMQRFVNVLISHYDLSARLDVNEVISGGAKEYPEFELTIKKESA